jgi:acylpyruvate hydrolase
MRLVTYGYRGCARAGAVVAEWIIDLERAQIYYYGGTGNYGAKPQPFLPVPADLKELIAGGSASLEAAGQAVRHVESQLEVHSEELVARGVLLELAEASLLPPIIQPGKIICLGLNYSCHAAEAGRDLPEAPELFAKFANALIGHGAAIQRPRVSEQLDYEAELAVVIGRYAKGVSAEKALDYVAGYTILNDVSVRDYQARTTQWLSGKSFDRTTPMGPWIVTPDEIGNPGELDITLDIDGVQMQRSNTSYMLFGIEQTIEFISTVTSLEPGDVISTGTPAGVGAGHNPPRWLRPGDNVTVTIDGIGALSNPIEDMSP